MRVEVRPIGEAFPNFPLGTTGEELACYIPPGIVWRQLGYGQGEGQVEIDGAEWGIYWSREGELSLILHSGRVELEAALTFVRGVASRITRGKMDCEINFVSEET
jgi:hypothetical protein